MREFRVRVRLKVKVKVRLRVRVKAMFSSVRDRGIIRVGVRVTVVVQNEDCGYG